MKFRLNLSLVNRKSVEAVSGMLMADGFSITLALKTGEAFVYLENNACTVMNINVEKDITTDEFSAYLNSNLSKRNIKYYSFYFHNLTNGNTVVGVGNVWIDRPIPEPQPQPLFAVNMKTSTSNKAN